MKFSGTFTSARDFFFLNTYNDFAKTFHFVKVLWGGGADSIKALARGPFGVPKVQYLFNIFFLTFYRNADVVRELTDTKTMETENCDPSS